MATKSSVLAWKIARTGEPSRLPQPPLGHGSPPGHPAPLRLPSPWPGPPDPPGPPAKGSCLQSSLWTLAKQQLPCDLSRKWLQTIKPQTHSSDHFQSSKPQRQAEPELQQCGKHQFLAAPRKKNSLCSKMLFSCPTFFKCVFKLQAI